MKFLSSAVIFLCCFVLSFHIASAADKTYVLKFNTVGGPQQPEVKGMEVFARELEKLSAGKIKVQVFHSGQLGNQQTQITGAMRGTLEMTFTDPNSLSRFDRSLGVFGAAYLFRDLDHLYRVMNGPIGSEYFERVAVNNGIRPLGVWYLGTRQLGLRDKAVRTPAEMRDVKLRMPSSPEWIAMGRALGANPTPMGFGEVYMALKTGVVDGQDNPLPTNEAMKFFEVTKYVVLTSHQIGMLWPSINEKLWKEMPEQYRSWIRTALAAAGQYQNRLVLDEEARLLKVIEKERGITVVRPDIEAFRLNARKIYADFQKDWGPGVYEKIQSSR